MTDNSPAYLERYNYCTARAGTCRHVARRQRKQRLGTQRLVRPNLDAQHIEPSRLSLSFSTNSQNGRCRCEPNKHKSERFRRMEHCLRLAPERNKTARFRKVTYRNERAQL